MKKKISPRTVIMLAAAIVFCAVCFIFAARFISAAVNRRQAAELKENLYHPASSSESLPDSGTEGTAGEGDVEYLDVPGGPELVSEPPALEIHEDFRELYELNSDVVGWLEAGDRIDYPVVQGDHDYYLNYDLYGKMDGAGVLFVNMANTLVPRDDVILIHGHNMVNGSMFGSLSRFRDFRYACKYPLINFRTIYDAENVYYTPVSVFAASMIEENPTFFEVYDILFEDDRPADEEGRHSSAFEYYLSRIRPLSDWTPLVDVNVNDKLLMLITCTEGAHSQDMRLLMICRALRPDETPEQIQELYQNALAGK